MVRGAAMTESTPTEHPHIVRTPGVVGGRPAIRGSRISVWHIARYLRAGSDVHDVILTYPHLPPAAIYDAISYYLDHKDEIDREIDEDILEKVAEKNGFVILDSGRMVRKAREASHLP
jgi:uncharacterized protein (DUF433 family)